MESENAFLRDKENRGFLTVIQSNKGKAKEILQMWTRKYSVKIRVFVIIMETFNLLR